jgi:hypothetical protein
MSLDVRDEVAIVGDYTGEWGNELLSMVRFSTLTMSSMMVLKSSPLDSLRTTSSMNASTKALDCETLNTGWLLTRVITIVVGSRSGN